MQRHIYGHSQKVIVPKGTINPTNDAVIEIPRCFQQQQIVIAQKAGEVPVPFIPGFNQLCEESCDGVKRRENVTPPYNQANRAVGRPLIIYV